MPKRIRTRRARGYQRQGCRTRLARVFQIINHYYPKGTISQQAKRILIAEVLRKIRHSYPDRRDAFNYIRLLDLRQLRRTTNVSSASMLGGSQHSAGKSH